MFYSCFASVRVSPSWHVGARGCLWAIGFMVSTVATPAAAAEAPQPGPAYMDRYVQAGRPILPIRVLRNIPYKTGATLSPYERERCVLDLYLPDGPTEGITLLWLHGGGLNGGSKDHELTVPIARRLAQAGLRVVVANYRLSPAVRYPAYVEDAAAAFAWMHAHIGEHGGDREKLFVGGHSAGAYLALMIGLDARYLRQADVPPSAIAGILALSSGVMSPPSRLADLGLAPEGALMADESAPIYHVAAQTPPLLLLYADNDVQARGEANCYFAAALRAAGNTRVTLRCMADRTHGTLAYKMPEFGDPVTAQVLAFVDRLAKERRP